MFWAVHPAVRMYTVCMYVYGSHTAIRLTNMLGLNHLFPQGDPLWSARLLYSDPQAILEAHKRWHSLVASTLHGY